MRIPGLFIHNNFLKSALEGKVINEASALYKEILKASQSDQARTQKAHSYLSQYHNLKSDEYFLSVKMGKIVAQYFSKYGENGHSLTYFIGNENIPSSIRELLINPISQLDIVKNLTTNTLDWNFTYNTYQVTEKNVLAGFPFHKDIGFNGVITMIYSLGTDSTLLMRLPKSPNSIESYSLCSDTLIIFSEDARWRYEHCVIPKKVDVPFSFLFKDVLRTSLVFGCKDSKSPDWEASLIAKKVGGEIPNAAHFQS